MRLLKSIFDFYLNSSIHVGLEVVCFVLLTGLRFQVPIASDFLGFVFLGTITGYNFIKYAGLAKWHHRSLTRNLRWIQLFSFACFWGWVFFATKLPLDTLWLAGLFGLFTVFYAVPVFPGKKNLRSLKGIKIFVIAWVVTGLTLIVPLVHHQISIGFEEAVVFLQRFAFIIAVLIPFEIRDLDFDAAELGTLPQKMGEKNAKYLGMALLVLFMALELVKPGPRISEILSTVLIGLVSMGFVCFASRNQSNYYAAFWVEALPIFWFLIHSVLYNSL